MLVFYSVHTTSIASLCILEEGSSSVALPEVSSISFFPVKGFFREFFLIRCEGLRSGDVVLLYSL